MAEADCDYSDAPGHSAGRHRSDDAKPDLSRPGGRVGQPPQGIVRVTRHLVFFAAWAIVALAGTASIDSKRRRLLGVAWEPFAAQTSIVPFAAIVAGRNRFIPREIGFWRWGVALLVYALMLGGHAPVIGVSPFPA